MKIARYGALLLATAVVGPLASAATEVTFTKDVLPILQENCQVCHRSDGANLGGMVAPMGFTTYKETRPWAKAIAKVVEARDMPPWDAHPKYHGVFKNERTLTQEEIDTIVAWVNQGAPRGREEDAPPPREFPNTGDWQIGEPDLIIEMPEPYFVQDEVTDIYVNFETPLTEEMLPEDRLIKAIEFRPGSPVVHHIISNPLGGVAPGNDPTVYDEGFYQLMRKGSSVTFEMHYHKEPGPGTGVWDQSSAAVKFYPIGYKPTHQIRMAPLGKFDFSVPPGDPNYSASVSQAFEDDVMIMGYTPHMHLRGKAAKYIATYPDGRTEDLLEVPGYDFNWQTTYSYAEPKILPAGSRVDLTMTWDNSPENPYNPDPTATVQFGEPTTAEMMFGFMNYAMVNEPSAVVVSETILDEYVGKYTVAGGPSFEISREGNGVSVSVAGQGPFPLEARSETKFTLDMADITIEFVRDDSGKVNSVSVDESGEKIVAQRAQ